MTNVILGRRKFLKERSGSLYCGIRQESKKYIRENCILRIMRDDDCQMKAKLQ